MKQNEAAGNSRMQLAKISQVVKCDIGICVRTADWTLVTPATMVEHRLNMCEQCMKELYNAIGTVIVPKSPRNMLGGKIERK